MYEPHIDRRGFLAALIDDGRPLLKLTGLAFVGSGLFAFFLGATRHFLPHDIAFLGVTSAELDVIAESRLVNFMIHDRVSFGGAILACGVLYLWMAEFPLRAGAAWAWWTFLFSGTIGFASFLAYLGYGYLDSWHGAATLVLLPLYAIGMYKSIGILQPERSARSLLVPGWVGTLRSAYGVGRGLLLLSSACLVLGGLIIGRGDDDRVCAAGSGVHETVRGRSGRRQPALDSIDRHDRAGFGGGVGCCGLTMLLCVYCSGPSRSLWQALAVVGLAGFGTAIGVHFPIGYTARLIWRFAVLGAAMFTAGMALSFDRMVRGASKSRPGDWYRICSITHRNRNSGRNVHRGQPCSARQPPTLLRKNRSGRRRRRCRSAAGWRPMSMRTCASSGRESPG